MKSEKGQSLVEFALVVPVLILILCGIIDFGQILHAHLKIDHAGREAARAASIGKSEAEIKDTAVNYGSPIRLQPSNVTVDLDSINKEAKITIHDYQVTFLTPLIGNIVGPLTLKENITIMRIE
ncbi:TadE family protein [Bacillus sp. JJ1532]|uniref:TadE/TadG family type IV pilus assembly protein n=1 Tax=unclassified Bacillus (in: firmicutes) TaxID=185979 RepID=UPI002FFEA453